MDLTTMKEETTAISKPHLLLPDFPEDFTGVFFPCLTFTAGLAGVLIPSWQQDQVSCLPAQ